MILYCELCTILPYLNVLLDIFIKWLQLLGNLSQDNWCQTNLDRSWCLLIQVRHIITIRTKYYDIHLPLHTLRRILYYC